MGSFVKRLSGAASSGRALCRGAASGGRPNAISDRSPAVLALRTIRPGVSSMGQKRADHATHGVLAGHRISQAQRHECRGSPSSPSVIRRYVLHRRSDVFSSSCWPLGRSMDPFCGVPNLHGKPACRWSSRATPVHRCAPWRKTAKGGYPLSRSTDPAPSPAPIFEQRPQ